MKATMAHTAKLKAIPAPLEKAPSPRVRLLQQAMQITSVDRDAAYGNPEDNFKNIATNWSAYLTQSTKIDIVITPQDVAHLMILMKIARLASNPTHYDSLLDVAGYAACGYDCLVAETQKNYPESSNAKVNTNNS